MKVTAAQLAEVYRRDIRTVRTWRKAGCPVEPDDVFDLEDVAAWREKMAERRGAKRSTAPTDLTDARTRREAALASQEELKLAEMQHELMTVADFEKALGDAFARVAAHLRNLPHKLAPAVVGVRDVAEGLTRVRPIVDEVMAELHRADDVPVPDDAEAA